MRTNAKWVVKMKKRHALSKEVNRSERGSMMNNNAKICYRGIMYTRKRNINPFVMMMLQMKKTLT